MGLKQIGCRNFTAEMMVYVQDAIPGGKQGKDIIAVYSKGNIKHSDVGMNRFPKPGQEIDVTLYPGNKTSLWSRIA